MHETVATLAGSLPLGDWQFWVVTAVAVGVAALGVRALIPKRRTSRRVSLTINRGEGREPGRPDENDRGEG